jgi:hypothetical protein
LSDSLRTVVIAALQSTADKPTKSEHLPCPKADSCLFYEHGRTTLFKQGLVELIQGLSTGLLRGIVETGAGCNPVALAG